MTSINISAERIAQVDAVIRKFVAGFLKPIESTDEFTSSYHPDVEWYDHAFLIRRVGHEAVTGLQRGFTWCNRPFNAEIKAIIPTATGAILEQVWVGRHANDLIRPNGDVAVKATGKDFQCHVLMVFQIDDNGKLTRIDEYYNKHWEDGVRDQDYLVMKGASMKSKV